MKVKLLVFGISLILTGIFSIVVALYGQAVKPDGPPKYLFGVVKAQDRNMVAPPGSPVTAVGTIATYVPTEVQSLRLQLAQQRAINAQQSLVDACGDGPTMGGKVPGTLRTSFQSQLDALSQEAAKVRKENGWPDTVGFDQGTLAFSVMPPDTTKPTAPPPVPATKKEPVKP